MTATETLTVSQAAQVSGLSVSTLKRRIAAKQLSATCSPAGGWVVKRGDLMIYLAVNESTKGRQETIERSGASGHVTVHESSRTVELLTNSLERERVLIEKLQAENAELRGENRRLTLELIATLKGEGKGMLSRWFKR